MARVDDAVRRILRVKAKLGLFDPARPYTEREILGSTTARAVARRAVAESMVLLKNNKGLLPIKPGQRVLVTGSHADDIGLQSGGWTLSWQGTGNSNSDFPNGTSIWTGLKAAIEAGGGTAVLSADGAAPGPKPDLAVVVFGETPYAEGVGDIPTLAFQPGDEQALAELQRLKARGIPTVSLFLSGRPLWVNRELNQSDAFVAGFLPGTEGKGVADVLVAKPDGTPDRDFHGKLSFSWPKSPEQYDLNVGQPGYDPLFAYGYGLTYQDHVIVPELPELREFDAQPENMLVYYAPGKVMPPWTLTVTGPVDVVNVDSEAQQEAARQFAFSGPARVSITGPSIDLSRESGRLSLRIDYRLDAKPAGKVMLMMGDRGSPVDVTSLFAAATPGAWTSAKVALACFAAAGADLRRVAAPFVLDSDGSFTLSIVGIKLEERPGAIARDDWRRAERRLTRAAVLQSIPPARRSVERPHPAPLRAGARSHRRWRRSP
jgi:beta-glucosidase